MLIFTAAELEIQLNLNNRHFSVKSNVILNKRTVPLLFS